MSEVDTSIDAIINGSNYGLSWFRKDGSAFFIKNIFTDEEANKIKQSITDETLYFDVHGNMKFEDVIYKISDKILINLKNTFLT